MLPQLVVANVQTHYAELCRMTDTGCDGGRASRILALAHASAISYLFYAVSLLCGVSSLWGGPLALAVGCCAYWILAKRVTKNPSQPLLSPSNTFFLAHVVKKMLACTNRCLVDSADRERPHLFLRNFYQALGASPQEAAIIVTEDDAATAQPALDTFMKEVLPIRNALWDDTENQEMFTLRGRPGKPVEFDLFVQLLAHRNFTDAHRVLGDAYRRQPRPVIAH